ncbi:CAP domain-containing protein [Verrucosispora sp. WMMA2121]|uniref:CAP domain-containing protein n=1 Tax=Verrucosispora sp. WMMA2121 TaxID=3015164 RepID=UPI0022B60EA8|nr:CAP domain-containing protein [Verrucosispora sp. WMMA2121]MCZ7420415.1 CAP domain-containing protein [Verrucosispora sp. WMMA2121]
MHGWNDPIDPERTPWRAEPPTDDPAWLTDRPAPRSSYLFGDDPAEPSDGWYREQPTEQWRSDAAAHPATEAYRPAEQPYPTTGQDWYDTSSARHQQTGRHHRDDEPTATDATDWPTHHAAPQESAYAYDDRPDWYTDQAVGYTDRTGAYAEPVVGPHYGPPQTGHRELAGVDEPAPEPIAATRRPRRLPRPLVMGGAAAAATLVVSIGVAALALPGDDAPTNTTAGQAPVASAPAAEEDPALTLDLPESTSPSASPSPSVSPSTATAAPSPSRTTRTRPAPSRSTAPSRLGTDRQGSPSRAASTSPSPSDDVTAEAAEVVKLVNAERAKAGCGALSIDDKLMTAAQRHSQDQADHRNMSHTGSDGSDPGDRIDRVDYAWRTYGENVAWNQRTPAAVMDAWMNSDGHRANILNCAFTEIGVGVARSNGPYWTQVFAAPR